MKKRWYLFHLAVTILLILGFQVWTSQRHGFGSRSEAGKVTPTVPVSMPVNNDPFSPERLAEVGERVIFGGHPLRFDPNQDIPVGRGQCPACHVILEGQRPTRFPKLIGVMARAGERVREARYAMFAKKYAETGEPMTGIRPHAKTAGEYLIESIYCPSCYVVEGFGLQGTDDAASLMPVINRPEVGLSDYEMAAIAAYIEAAEAKGDLSKVTARGDWENYFGRKLTAGDARETTAASAPSGDLTKVGLAQETPEEIIQKMACFACHKIPTVPIAQIGKIGPPLTLKTAAARRIRSPEYQRALREGRVRATTPREYVIESILNPSGFIVPGFDDAMPKTFKEKLTFAAVERLADFLLTLDEESGASPTGAGGALKNRE